ncbi:MAG: A/G-specific adenine glycosylase, partial [Spirochaetota bacterium]
MSHSSARRSNSAAIRRFRTTVYRYFLAHKRDLPWRHTHDPYRILVSEIMLQQTQIPRVIEKYGQFIHRFGTIRSLAKAPLSTCLTAWQGLGYNRRAVFLHRLAKEVVRAHSGEIPRSVEALETLPGIGHYTARAVCAFAFNIPSVFIETNIRSVFIH